MAPAQQGRPIIGPAFEVDRANRYGAGQPSVVHLDGLFYLLFTDTTASGALDNGAGQFACRSADRLGPGVPGPRRPARPPVPQRAAARRLHRPDRQRVDVTSQTFHQIPYGASPHTGAPAIVAAGRPAGYLLDDGRLWPVADNRLITANSSPVTTVSTQTYDSYPKGPTLRHAWP